MPSTDTRSASLTARLCLFAAACSGSIFGFAPFPAHANTLNSAKVCAMVSQSDLRTWFKKNWVVIQTTDAAPKHCSWGPPGSYSTFTVEIARADQYVDGETAVPGIGDKAHLDEVVGTWRGRAVKGKYAVNFFTSSAGVSRTTALTVLKQLVARL